MLFNPKTIKEIKSDINANQLLLISARYNFMDGVKYAIKIGADANVNGRLAFAYANNYDNSDMLKLLRKFITKEDSKFSWIIFDMKPPSIDINILKYIINII